MKVKDLMVPLSEYATVPESATLQQAVLALDNAHDQYQHHHYKHRAVLVLDKDGQAIGKLSQMDIIKAIEPRYGEITDSTSLSRFGLSSQFLKSIIASQGLWQKPLENLCANASKIKVEEIMYIPEEGEYVEEEASLDEGIHQLVMGHHHSLLVTRNTKVVGVLRLTDVFTEICTIIKSCQS